MKKRKSIILEALATYATIAACMFILAAVFMFYKHVGGTAWTFTGLGVILGLTGGILEYKSKQ